MKPHLRNSCTYQVPVNQLKSLTHSDNHQDIFFCEEKTKQNSKSLSALGWTQLKHRQKRQSR